MVNIKTKFLAFWLELNDFKSSYSKGFIPKQIQHGRSGRRNLLDKVISKSTLIYKLRYFLFCWDPRHGQRRKFLSWRYCPLCSGFELSKSRSVPGAMVTVEKFTKFLFLSLSLPRRFRAKYSAHYCSSRIRPKFWSWLAANLADIRCIFRVSI